MKFIADINLTQTVIRNLRRDGHDVLDIKKQNPTISDSELVKLALRQNRIILTHDKDFESLANPRYEAGIIAIRLKIQNAQYHWLKLSKVLSIYNEDDLSKSLTIITEKSVESTPYD